jgi:predicted esterase YcpF (UPF0227 family)
MTQPHLMPPTKDEHIQALKEALEKYGKHSLYCCWVYEGGYYDKTLGCTCGLKLFNEA